VVGGLTADLLVVAKGLDLRGSAFEGVVRLLGADITGQLSLRSAKLTGTNRDGNALVGDEMKVGGSVLLDKGFSAAGAVRLPDADITGPLFCSGAKLAGTDGDGNTLVGDLMRVSGSVFLDKGFSAAGAVSIPGARIGGSLVIEGAELAEPVALKASGVRIGGQLRWAPRSPVGGLVDLERAEVHWLDDDWSLSHAHWPPAKQLRLGWVHLWIRWAKAGVVAAAVGLDPARPHDRDCHHASSIRRPAV
jgi:hypothetical protein